MILNSGIELCHSVRWIYVPVRALTSERAKKLVRTVSEPPDLECTVCCRFLFFVIVFSQLSLGVQAFHPLYRCQEDETTNEQIYLHHGSIYFDFSMFIKGHKPWNFFDLHFKKFQVQRIWIFGRYSEFVCLSWTKYFLLRTFIFRSSYLAHVQTNGTKYTSVIH